MTGRRRVLFPLAAVCLALALLGLLEVGLRLGGVGYPTAFFLPAGEGLGVTTNPRFGWRFFPPAVARAPVLEHLPAEKPAGSFRAFVLGGSAAMGTPDHDFGFGRFLEVMLEQVRPDVRVQVVNAAMAAVSSHVVLEIARDCARQQPDAFLVYLGNNEVVGPYGPGTVFRRYLSSLTATRVATRCRRTRIAQLMEMTWRAAGWGDRDIAQWKGMEMFLDRQVELGDRRLEHAYDQLERNLRGIVAVGRRAGAAVILSTVAVNLRDSPPFASASRSAEEASRKELLEQAAAATARGALEDAVAALEEAVSVAPDHAEGHYLLAKALLAARRPAEARGHFVRARDLDTLRFRADSRINEIIRGVATEAGEGQGVFFLDGEEAIESAPEVVDGIPGSSVFYEHVHLKVTGNYRLAAAFLEPVLHRLAPTADGEAAEPPSLDRCAESLALTADDLARMESTIYEMTKRPPFTGQHGHDTRQAARRRKMHRLEALARSRRGRDLELLRRRVEERPGDLRLHRRFASLLSRAVRLEEAAEQWRGLIVQLPGVAAWHTELAFALADQGQLAEAETQMRRALELQPWSPSTHLNLGLVLDRQRRLDEAEQAYAEALRLAPASALAHFNLAVSQEKRGNLAAAADRYRAFLEIDPLSAEACFRLGSALERLEDDSGAEAAYLQAVALDPDLAKAHNNLGGVRERSGRLDEAGQSYLDAIASDPFYALARFNLADLLFARGNAAGAVEVYRAALDLEPENLQARINLAAAQSAAGLVEESRETLLRALRIARVQDKRELAQRVEELLSSLGG